jgi:hypothetical protein
MNTPQALRKKHEERDTHCVGNARKSKSPGHPATGRKWSMR